GLGERGRRAVRVARPPEERAARFAETVEPADEGEIAQRFLLQSDAAGEVVEAPERAALALAHDRLGLGLTEPLHLREAEPHVLHAAGAMRGHGLRGVRHA